ncbi:MAG TPA: isoprenyl transferase [Aestuariivirgaceae bacterium]|nr:isoprenyl transferase [Aestuariivirgaceae bacterium]
MNQPASPTILQAKKDGRFPRHVALIMDGNGRWARKRFLPRSAGHVQGVDALRRTIRAALDLEIEYLTIYSFSSENWSRPADEINELLDILRRFVSQDVAELHAAGVRIRIIGSRAKLSPDILGLLDHSERLTADNRRMTLVVAFNYGSRWEIADAMREIAEDCRAGRLAVSDISPEKIGDYLGTAGIPDPDLLIRTSGEQRLSNFLLWQCAYTEFVFIPDHWPDFGRDQLERALETYLSRDRRFGGIAARVV